MPKQPGLSLQHSIPLLNFYRNPVSAQGAADEVDETARRQDPGHYPVDDNRIQSPDNSFTDGRCTRNINFQLTEAACSNGFSCISAVRSDGLSRRDRPSTEPYFTGLAGTMEMARCAFDDAAAIGFGFPLSIRSGDCLTDSVVGRSIGFDGALQAIRQPGEWSLSLYPGPAMTVICDICQAANRDKAMFCSGCAGKLQAFLANGPSMLSKLDESAWRHLRGRSVPQADHASRSIQSLGRRTTCCSWLAGAMLLATGLVAALSWNGLSNASPERPDAHASGTPDVAVARSTVDDSLPTGAEATPASILGPSPATTQPPGRIASAVPRQPPRSVAPSRPAPSIQPPPAPDTGADPSSSVRRDPRTGCQHLFFAFAARCAANHCLEASYAGHSHCDQVRAEARRDEARRNMTLN